MNVAPEAVRPRFEGFFVPEQREKPPRGSHEKVIVISDLHGSQSEVLGRLHSLTTSKDKPKAVILAGDVAGNSDLEELQRLYYNHLTNHTRNDKLQTDSVLDGDLLSYGGKKPPYKGYTVKKGFLSLRAKELSLQGLSHPQIGEILGDMTDDVIASEIKRYAQYEHYGHYASNLPEAAVRKLADGLRENAQQIAGPLKELRDAGVRVVISEGNWDPSPPIAFKRGTTAPQRLSSAEQQDSTGFGTQKFFEQEGIEYVTTTHVIETDTAVLVLLPFDQLVKYSNIDREVIKENEKEKLAAINKARDEGKQVIVVQHGEVMWEPHNLTNPQSRPKGEHEKVIAGSNNINALIQPDEVLYGHFHDPFTDEEGNEQPIDTKYTVVFDNTPVIIPMKDHAEGQTVVSYMPLRRFSTVLIPFDNESNRRKIKGFGGERQPAEVT
jgi:Icc-related predicted phosphoesterase